MSLYNQLSKSIVFIVAIVTLALVLGACSTMPTGKTKVELIDRLVADQEFNKIQKLLTDIDTRDPEFEALVIRRRAIRPLIVQFEQHTIRQASLLQAQDQWPQALTLLRGAQRKLANSEALQTAENQFFEQRAARLQHIQQQIGLLDGKNQRDKTPLVEKIVDIHPTGFRSRWQWFQHQRKNKDLAEDLFTCGEQAMEEQALDLAEACFSMVKALSTGIDVSVQLSQLALQRVKLAHQRESLAQQEAEKQQRARDLQIAELREQYQQLSAAGWLAAAKQTLAQLRVLAPGDSEFKTWANDLQLVIDQQVQEAIHRGQALYSDGSLEEALAAWEYAADLDPENPVLQGHIARAERFLKKLHRLDQS